MEYDMSDKPVISWEYFVSQLHGSTHIQVLSYNDTVEQKQKPQQYLDPSRYTIKHDKTENRNNILS
jgi:hypothetical protein